jgi:hypothetical protein
MGYHVELVASSPRKIPWADVSDAARGLGWQVTDADKDIGLVRDARLQARLSHADDGPWVKSPDDGVLVALVELASLRSLHARGDEWESCRSITDWNIHPNDAKDHSKAAAPYPGPKRPAQRQRAWDMVRIAVLAPLSAFKSHGLRP